MGLDASKSDKPDVPSVERLAPANAQALAECLRACQEAGAPVAFSAEEAALLPRPQWLDIGALNRIRHEQPEDFIVRVDAGVTFGALDEALRPFNQSFPLSYPAHARVGDILADDRPSLETGLRGYPRDYTLKTEVAAPDGGLTTSGADVVKNVTGYDLHKFYVGSRNAFGVLTAVTLKLMARSRSCRYASVMLSGLMQAEAIVHALQAESLPLTVCELLREESGAFEMSASSPAWRLVLGIAGEPALLDEAETAIRRIVDALPLERLSEPEAQRLLESLQCWPVTAAVLEVVLPLGQWRSFLQTVENSDAFRRIQARPFAGLAYLFSESEDSPAVLLSRTEALQPDVESRAGFLQWVQWPFRRLGLDGFQPLADRFNCPADPAVRCLLKSLKESYDPKGILFTPYLPLTSVLLP